MFVIKLIDEVIKEKGRATDHNDESVKVCISQRATIGSVVCHASDEGSPRMPGEEGHTVFRSPVF